MLSGNVFRSRLTVNCQTIQILNSPGLSMHIMGHLKKYILCLCLCLKKIKTVTMHILFMKFKNLKINLEKKI